MALMERVATLLRANLNDLIDRAEDPEKMLRQLVLDMENQLLQVKTQVAIALADQHLLEKKTLEQEAAVSDWHRKAELAVSKGDDALARAALERAVGHEKLLEAMRAQVSDQTAEAAALRASFGKLQTKLAETRTRCELLIAEHRRARMVSKAAHARQMAQSAAGDNGKAQAISRAEAKMGSADTSRKASEALADMASLEERLARLETDDRIEQMLTELKSRQQRLLPTG
jgi:phage shock protein A